MASRASVGPIPGKLVVGVSLFLYLVVFVVALATIGLQHSTGEVLPRFEGISSEFLSSVTEAGKRNLHPKAWFRSSGHRRKQLLTFIVTDKPDKVSERITKEMSRGATVVAGKGAYTGKEHAVLLVALTVTEVSQLKALVAEEDTNAFVIVSPSQWVFGKGFARLEEDE